MPREIEVDEKTKEKLEKIGQEIAKAAGINLHEVHVGVGSPNDDIDGPWRGGRDETPEEIEINAHKAVAEQIEDVQESIAGKKEGFRVVQTFKALPSWNKIQNEIMDNYWQLVELKKQTAKLRKLTGMKKELLWATIKNDTGIDNHLMISYDKKDTTMRKMAAVHVFEEDDAEEGKKGLKKTNAKTGNA